MREFLLGLYLEHGERAFPYVIDYDGAPVHKFGQARALQYITLISRKKYNAELLPYKLTAKALEYIKAHD